jgi:hypothetical protein
LLTDLQPERVAGFDHHSRFDLTEVALRPMSWLAKGMPEMAEA